MKHSLFLYSCLFLKIFYYLFLERGKGGRKTGRETLMCDRNIDWVLLIHPQQGTWPATQACVPTRNQTSDPSVCRLVLNPLSHTSQGYLFINYCIIYCCYYQSTFAHPWTVSGAFSYSQPRNRETCVYSVLCWNWELSIEFLCFCSHHHGTTGLGSRKKSGPLSPHPVYC